MVVTRGEVMLVGERWEGKGPVVVLLHAGVADRRSWRMVAEDLVGSATLVAYDRRGHGQTAPPTTPFSHLDDLLAVLDHIGGDAVWLVGNSMGGGLALDAVLEVPTRVAGLVLLAPAVSGAPEPEPDAEIASFLERLTAAVRANDLDEVNRLETWLWLDGPAGPEGRVGGEARALALDMNAIILGHDVDEDAGAGGVDAWDRLEEVGVPATVACGDLDLGFLIGRSRTLARRLPRGRHRVLAGMAHLPSLEQPGVVADLVREALASA